MRTLRDTETRVVYRVVLFFVRRTREYVLIMIEIWIPLSTCTMVRRDEIHRVRSSL